MELPEIIAVPVAVALVAAWPAPAGGFVVPYILLQNLSYYRILLRPYGAPIALIAACRRELARYGGRHLPGAAHYHP